MTQLRTCIAPGVFSGIGLSDIGSGVFNLGFTQPIETNAGTPFIGDQLTDYDADIVTPRTIYIDTPGTIIDAKRLGNIRLYVRTFNVVIMRCFSLVMNSGTTDNVAIINADNSNVRGLQIIQNTIINMDQKGYNIDAAIRGHDFDAYRNKIMGTMDGIRPNLGGNWKIRGNFIGFLGWWASNSNGTVQPNDVQTHSDCIQTTYGGGIIEGNTLLAYPSTVVGTGTPGSGSDTGNSGSEYTQAQAVARRAQLMGSSWTIASTSYGGVSREVGGVITPLMCNVASGPTAMNLTVRRNWLGGGSVQINALAANLTDPVGTFEGNRHYNDSKNKVAGKAIGYRVRTGLAATIPLTGDLVNTYMDDGSVVERV